MIGAKANTTILRALALGALLLAIGLTTAVSAQAALPAWKVFGVTGPTNLPPQQSEVQRLSVTAQSGTYKLSFEGEETSSIAYNAGANTVRNRLNALAAIGGAGGSVTVAGGPGGEGIANPYVVSFGGSLAETDVPQLVANDEDLEGDGSERAWVETILNGGPGTGEITVHTVNVGGAPTSGAFTVTIGPLPTGIVSAGEVTGANSNPWSCEPKGTGHDTIACTRSPVSPARRQTSGSLTLPIQIDSSAAPSSSVAVRIEGGGAGVDEYEIPITVSAIPAPAGLEVFWAGAFDEDGVAATQAGAHPEAAFAYFRLNTVRSPAGEINPAGAARDILTEAPPGFAGNPLLGERCTQQAPTCGDPDAEVGVLRPHIFRFISSGESQTLFNVEPPHGRAAQFSFKYIDPIVSLVASLRSDEDYGVTVKTPNVNGIVKLFGAFAALDGFPAGGGGKPFLSNPTGCSTEAQGTPVTTFAVNSWQQPTIFDTRSWELPKVSGCDQLDFEADLNARPTTNVADSPTGLDVDLHIPQEKLTDPEALVNPHLRHTTVELPEGLVINPSGANGLDGCSTDEVGLLGTGFAMPNPIRFDQSPVECPDASKVGAAEVESPLIDHPLKGAVYLADPFDNPFNSLLAIYLVIEDPRSGIVVKLPGTVDRDSNTGRISSTFENNPQVPFSDLRLDFKGGAHAPLITPPACGGHETRTTMTPWSAPESGPPLVSVDSYAITQGPNGGCASSEGALPNSPGFDAGSASPIAGAHSPFVVNLSRGDGTQRFAKVTVSPPPGLVAKLAGVAQCSDAALAAAAGKSGRDEQASPSCPASSRLGSVHTKAGAGPAPYNAPGEAYLAGPHNGAPLSMAILTPAVAGPFDLGTVVVRVALHVDPATAQITAVTDQLPRILEGIPLNIRSASVRIDRPDFTLNPTSCAEMALGGELLSTLGSTASLAQRFQLGECRRLGFKPRTAIRLFGGIKRGSYQGVRAVVRPRGGDANISRAVVRFPRSAFVAQEHLKNICTRVQFAADACPKSSIYGTALAHSPLLDYPLTGNVHLRSSENTLPDLVADLRGPAHQPIRIEVTVRNDSVKGALRNTVQAAPDAPVSYFRLQTFGGDKGLIVNSRNICRGKNRAIVGMAAHNGRRQVQRVNVFNRKCKAFKRKLRKAKRRKAKRSAHRSKLRVLAGARGRSG